MYFHDSRRLFPDWFQFLRQRNIFCWRRPLRNYAGQYQSGLFLVQRLLHYFCFCIGQAVEQIKLQNAKFDTCLILNFLLKCIGKFGKALVCHHMEQINIAVLNLLSVLIDTQAQSTPDFLTGSQGAFLVNQCTDLEYIGIVPSLFQCGVGENKAQGTGEGQKPLLIPHDGVVGAGIVLRVASGVFVVALFVLREITIMNSGSIRRKMLPQRRILGNRYQFSVQFLKHLRIDSLAAILGAVLLHLVDEKQGQHLDALFRIA